MSSFRGDPHGPWSVARAVDALAAAARSAGRPGWIWIAGVFYPALSLFPGVGWLGGAFAGSADEGVRIDWDAASGLPGVTGLQGVWSGVLGVCFSLPALPVLLILARLIVGLARVGAPQEWARRSAGERSPRLGAVWKAGQGQTIAAAGMWVLLASMLVGAALLLGLPATEFARWAIDSAGMPRGLTITLVLVPPLVLLTAYAAVVSVLQQLALQSLVHNRRGVGSALVHAWSLARRDPWATLRTLAVDGVLVLAVGGLSLATDLVCGLLGAATLGWLVSVCLAGFVGVTRAGYWARSYAGLGGLTPADGVPGLGDEGPPEAGVGAWARGPEPGGAKW